MCIRDRARPTPNRALLKKNKKLHSITMPPDLTRIGAVSYTHLDVYKRQAAVMGAGLTSGRDRPVTSSVMPRVKRSFG